MRTSNRARLLVSKIGLGHPDETLSSGTCVFALASLLGAPRVARRTGSTPSKIRSTPGARIQCDSEDASLPEPVEPVSIEPPELSFDAESLDRLFSSLDTIEAPRPLAALMEGKPFDEASFHLSLLALLGSRGELGEHDPAARLTTYSLELQTDAGLVDVPSGDVGKVSIGHVRPKET